MHVIAWALSGPGAHLRVFVGRVVVDDEVQLEGSGHAAVEVPQEREELLMTMARLTLGDDLGGSHFESGKQGRSAVPVIVGLSGQLPHAFSADVCAIWPVVDGGIRP